MEVSVPHHRFSSLAARPPQARFNHLSRPSFPLPTCFQRRKSPLFKTLTPLMDCRSRSTIPHALDDNGSPPLTKESDLRGRVGEVRRVMKETNVHVKIDLDGNAVAENNTGIPFLDHMLDQLASHGLFDVHVKATGDTHIDDHHTNEDVALAIGTGLLQALGDRRGIDLFGDFSAPLDEALIHVSLIMCGHRGKFKEPMSWPDVNENAFIEILYDKVKSGMLQCSTFTKDEWGKINEAMMAATNMDYGIERLKGKWNRLRMTHRLFSALVRHTGVTWDPKTNFLDVPEQVWKHFYTINKTQYKIFKKEGCRHYETLGQIFSGTTATGGLGMASTQPPPTSDEERQIEDDFLTKGGVHVCVENDDVTNTHRSEEIGTSGERQHKERKISKVDRLEACMDQWSSSVSSREEETKLRKLYLKEKLAKLQGKSSNKTESEITSQDPYCRAICLDILNNMENVSNEVYMKALPAFENPNFRMSFVKMPEIRRGPILEML